MKTHRILPLVLLLLAANHAAGYPPAPFHRIFGKIRDDHGNPFGAGDGMVILYGAGDKEIVRAPTDPEVGTGLNYSLSVPMDAGITSQLYTVSALRPAYPFTIRMVRGNVSYLPIQMQGTAWKVGDPAGSTRIDLTLGIDSDGDGLPDAWEEEAMRTDSTGRFNSLASIKPGDDSDGDGLTNLQEYIAGTYAMDSSDGLFLKVISVASGVAKLEFLAIANRTYQLKSSADLKVFGEQPFSFATTAANPVSSYLATDTRMMEIYVTVGEAKSKIFQLYAN